MAVAWPENVNVKFYGLDGRPVNNRESTQFKSGRVIYKKINSVQKHNFNVRLYLDDKTLIGTQTEFDLFMAWYETTNGSGTAKVALTDILTGSGTTEYYVTVESWDGQAYKEVRLSLEEC